MAPTPAAKRLLATARCSLPTGRCNDREYGDRVYASGFSLLRAIRKFDAYSTSEEIDATDRLEKRVVFKTGQSLDSTEMAVRGMVDEMYRLPMSFPDKIICCSPFTKGSTLDRTASLLQARNSLLLEVRVAVVLFLANKKLLLLPAETETDSTSAFNFCLERSNKFPFRHFCIFEHL